jgi:hypothetical protein
VQLQLRTTDVEGHWIETSLHRNKLMPMYNRYILQKDPVNDEEMAWRALFAIWQAAFLLNKYVFTHEEHVQPVHPLGMGEWTDEDADLSGAVVISMSASSKTGRSFAYHLSSREAKNRHFRFLQVMSGGNGKEYLRYDGEDKFLGYDELKDGVNWIGKGPIARKIVVVDFGARGNSLSELVELIQSHRDLKGIRTVILQVGNQQKVSIIPPPFYLLGFCE